jgi:hypothetical protein
MEGLSSMRCRATRAMAVVATQATGARQQAAPTARVHATPSHRMNHPAPLILLAIGCLALGVWGTRHYTRWRMRRRMARMRQAGRRGEARAERWLRAHGFSIESEQVARACTVRVNGSAVSFDVRADYLVRDPKGALAVVEVKTGAAADPRATGTRRQLFEYAAVYGVQDVYLFDGSAEQLLHLEFLEPAGPRGRPRGGRLVWILLGFAVGALVATRVG